MNYIHNFYKSNVYLSVASGIVIVVIIVVVVAVGICPRLLERRLQTFGAPSSTRNERAVDSVGEAALTLDV